MYLGACIELCEYMSTVVTAVKTITDSLSTVPVGVDSSTVQCMAGANSTVKV